MRNEIKLVSSMEKVFSDMRRGDFREHKYQTALKGEYVSFQVVLNTYDVGRSLHLHAQAESPLGKCDIWEVGEVPAQLPTYEGCNLGDTFDPYYLRCTPGLYPDPLYDTCDTGFRLPWGQSKAVWVRIKVPTDAKPGEYPVTVKVQKVSEYEEIEQILEDTFTIRVIDVELPKPDYLYSQWIHYDCLATYYNVPVFSEEHWEIIGNFFENAVEYGMTACFTPLVTPPLDTQVGTERPTVQLVDVTVENGKMTLGFDKMDRFVDLALSKGFSQFELSHLFTQWGATSAPKVMATVDGEYKRIFGWETPSASPEYIAFLRLLISETKEYFRKRGLLDKCLWHISDEPGLEHIPNYLKAREGINDLLADVVTTDAVSKYEFLEQGLIKSPIVGIDHLEPFFEHGAKDFFTYYCCGHDKAVSNRFFAMPSARNRILGLQLYKYDQITGFLQWGYNFYYTQYSRKAINPFLVTDAHCAFPAGDSFMVYPGENGKPIPSLRQVIFYEGFQDMAALKLLETVMPREEIIAWLDERCGKDGLQFKKYPCDNHGEWAMETRELINKMLEEKLAK